MDETLWTLRSARLSGSSRPRLDDVTLTIRRGVTSVIGCSGAGKTSLLNLLVGFEKPDRGQVVSHASKVFWAPPNDGLWPHLTVKQHLEAVGGAGDLLERFDLTDRADTLPAILSAGERSRLAVARALAAGPDVLVMDEPLVHVERGGAARYWQVIREHLERAGASLVFATHEPDTVLREAGRVVCMSDGRVIYDGAVAELYQRPPSEELARFLGDVNWLTPADAAVWLEQRPEQPLALRPEKVRLVTDERSPIELRDTRSIGAVAESRLVYIPTGQARRFVHQPLNGAVRTGQRVALNVLALLAMALCLLGCGDRGGDTLTVKQVNHWPMPPDGNRIPAPRSITIGPDDQVIVLDNAGRVLIFDAHGELLTRWNMPTNEDGNPEGACWLKDGRIAVADTHYHRVLFFDQRGELLDTLGRHSEDGEPGTFRYPVDVVQDDDENLYVAEYGGGDRVQKFTRDGAFVTAFGSVGTGPGQFQRAAGLVWHQGRVYVADAVNGRVHVFTDDGQLLGDLGGLSFNYPYDAALAPDHTLFIVEWGAGRVLRTTLDGRVLGRFGTPGSGKGQLRTPWGVGVDSHMRVRIADTENRRIVELIL